jgi:hypothetical protein
MKLEKGICFICRLKTDDPEALAHYECARAMNDTNREAKKLKDDITFR